MIDCKMNDLEWLFHVKIRFRLALLESERLILRCSVHNALHNQLASLGRHAQLTRCFSAVAALLVSFVANPVTVHVHEYVYIAILWSSSVFWD